MQSGLYVLITMLQVTQAGYLQCARPFLAVCAVLTRLVGENPNYSKRDERQRFISVGFGMVYLWRPQVQEPVTVVMAIVGY